VAVQRLFYGGGFLMGINMIQRLSGTLFSLVKSPPIYFQPGFLVSDLPVHFFFQVP
jgi:hypothetical protein